MPLKRFPQVGPCCSTALPGGEPEQRKRLTVVHSRRPEDWYVPKIVSLTKL